MNHRLTADSIILDFNGRNLLNGVYLEANTGEVTGLLGRNGTGKTCLMRILYGELATEGSVCLDGLRFLDCRRRKEDMRFLPQFNFIPRHLKVRDVFDFFELDFADCVDLFPEVSQYDGASMQSLSSGERRIVETYLILVSKTKFCILDEPFSQIMPLHVTKIKELILREREHKGILLSDHYYDHVVDLCNRIYLINNSKIQIIKNKEDLRKHGYIP